MLNPNDYMLRPLSQSDLQQVLTWRNSDRVRSCMCNDSTISWSEHYKWYKESLKNPTIRIMICEFQDRPIGLINAAKIDSLNSKCSWGFYLGDMTASKKSGYVMSLLFLDFIFDSLGIRKVYGEVLGFNVNSLLFHKNLGFTQEGILKKHFLRNDSYVDFVLFGLLDDKWKEVRHKTESQLF
jgi:UDP-4-amino-4,6-dideoxy-N-acetyl-beta-L-altrosamine N-acetyltransferase